MSKPTPYIPPKREFEHRRREQQFTIKRGTPRPPTPRMRDELRYIRASEVIPPKDGEPEKLVFRITRRPEVKEAIKREETIANEAQRIIALPSRTKQQQRYKAFRIKKLEQFKRTLKIQDKFVKSSYERVFERIPTALRTRYSKQIEAQKRQFAKGNLLAGAGAFTAAGIDRLGIGAFQALTFPIRPGLWVKTGRGYFLIATDKEVRNQVAQGIKADPFGFSMELAGGLVGGYVVGKALNKILNKAGLGPKKVVETRTVISSRNVEPKHQWSGPRYKWTVRKAPIGYVWRGDRIVSIDTDLFSAMKVARGTWRKSGKLGFGKESGGQVLQTFVDPTTGHYIIRPMRVPIYGLKNGGITQILTKDVIAQTTKIPANSYYLPELLAAFGASKTITELATKSIDKLTQAEITRLQTATEKILKTTTPEDLKKWVENRQPVFEAVTPISVPGVKQIEDTLVVPLIDLVQEPILTQEQVQEQLQKQKQEVETIKEQKQREKPITIPKPTPKPTPRKPPPEDKNGRRLKRRVRPPKKLKKIKIPLYSGLKPFKVTFQYGAKGEQITVKARSFRQAYGRANAKRKSKMHSKLVEIERLK